MRKQNQAEVRQCFGWWSTTDGKKGHLESTTNGDTGDVEVVEEA